MKSVVFIGLLACISSATASTGSDPLAGADLDVPFKKVVLTNGLTVIVHEDHKAPIVAVDVWYHVGSGNEKPGKTGFAHLFEHIMFTGSEHLKGEGNQRAFYEAMDRIGAYDANGTTNPDATRFYETVPTNGLDTVLWIESDRMGHLLGSVDQARLDLQRGVVQNEKRQGENQPYGAVEELITKGTAPVGHPYSWTTIGSMEDLNAATLDDVHTWFKTYYGAANAVLVIAGDVDTETAVKKAEHYFGGIPPGPPISRISQWFPQMHGTRREKLQDRVPQARVYEVWNVPGYGDPDSEYLGMLQGVLSWGKDSRLYKRLVYDEQLATDVSVWIYPQEISEQFVISATARPGVELSAIEKAIDDELARLRDEGPKQEELERTRVQMLSGFVRDTERVIDKTYLLALNQTLRGSPDYYKTIRKYQREASLQDLASAIQSWLTKDVYILEVEPYPEFASGTNMVDRSKLPIPNALPDPTLPPFQRAKLSNGMKVIVAERHQTPLVNMHLLVDAGSAADDPSRAGAARLTVELLDGGTSHRTALELSDQLASIGARFATECTLEDCSVGLSALTSTLDDALELYADVVVNPAFPETDFKRLQTQALARVQQEKAEPRGTALRIFPRLLYGEGHAYANPITGSGTEKSISALTRSDLQQFHQRWFKPNNATLIIVGDTSLKEMTPKLEKYFGQWKPGAVPKKNVTAVEQKKKTAIYLVDRPGSLQSLIFAGHIAPPRADPDQIAINAMNSVLGGGAARLQMNLRENKHWSYGAASWLIWERGQSPFVIYAPVQTDKTSDAMVEVNKEVRGILGDKPVTQEELDRIQKKLTLTLPGNWETDDQVIRAILQIVRFGLPDDYFATYPRKVRDLSIQDVSAAARKVLHPDQLIWVIIGDRAKIESGIRNLGWSDLQFLDADGNAIN